MTSSPCWCRHIVAVLPLLAGLFVVPVLADEFWVAPTYQQDVGGLGIGSNGIWPVTAIGAVRLAWGIPNNLETFQSAKVAIIPHTPGGPATLNIFICAAQNSDLITGACAGPFAHPFTGVPNQLVEVDISAVVAPRIGVAGANYLAVVAFTTPTTGTDHIVGLRFAYGAGGGVPTGMVGFFAGATCPTSWTEYASAQGRVVVGLPSGGTAEGTVGSGLANLGTRTITDVPSHTHVIDPPNTTSSIDGTHIHTIPTGAFGFGQNLLVRVVSTSGGPAVFSSAAGPHSHTVDIGAFNSGATGSASVDVSMPYVQLIACRKS